METPAGLGVGQDRFETDARIFQVMQDTDAVNEVAQRAAIGGQIALVHDPVGIVLGRQVAPRGKDGGAEVDALEVGGLPAGHVEKQTAIAATELKDLASLGLGPGERGKPVLKLGARINRPRREVVPRSSEGVGSLEVVGHGG